MADFEKVDVKKELDEIFSTSDDVEHLIGVCEQNHNGVRERIAFVRMIARNANGMLAWPKQIAVLRALDVDSGVEMLVLAAPDSPYAPLLATEWHEAHLEFFESIRRHRILFCEMWTPTMCFKAGYLHERLVESVARPITRKEFDEIDLDRTSAMPNTIGGGVS
jgi:hypothetical protein